MTVVPKIKKLHRPEHYENIPLDGWSHPTAGSLPLG